MWKDAESILKRAYLESLSGERKGDRVEEVKLLSQMVLNSRWGVVTDNIRKFTVIKNTLSLFGIENVEQIVLPTSTFDLLQIPALFKALAGKRISSCDIFLARGRVGLPGSGALTVAVNREGDIISAVTSPPHFLHSLSLEAALFLDTFRLLQRMGIKPIHRGITDRTRTVYSPFSILDVSRKISERKAEPLRELKGNRLLIVGGYLDGLFLSEFLKGNFQEIYLHDMEGAVLELSPVPQPEGLEEFDVILDLTGYGGAAVLNGRVENFRGRVVVSESPSGAMKLETEKKPHYWLKPREIPGKTSGTMTLTVKLVRNISCKAEEMDAVLYAVPNLLFFESLLFNLKSSRAFLEFMDFPAVTVSVRKEGAAEVEEALVDILEKELSEMKFELERV